MSIEKIKSVNIMGVNFSVEFVVPMSNGTQVLGSVSYAEAAIKIDPQPRAEIRKRILTHEIVHALCFMTNIRMNEKDTDTLANALVLMFENNPEVMDFLTKKESQCKAKTKKKAPKKQKEETE